MWLLIKQKHLLALILCPSLILRWSLNESLSKCAYTCIHVTTSAAQSTSPEFTLWCYVYLYTLPDLKLMPIMQGLNFGLNYYTLLVDNLYQLNLPSKKKGGNALLVNTAHCRKFTLAFVTYINSFHFSLPKLSLLADTSYGHIWPT